MSKCRLHRCALLIIAAVTLVVCGDKSGTQAADDPPTAAAPVPGESKGEYFYPEFQRWNIVEAKPVAGATIPADARGIPAILRGRSVFLSSGYMTMPFLNADGDVLTPGCFTAVHDELRMQSVDPRTAGRSEPMVFRGAPGGRLLVTYERMFELTLERSSAADADQQQRMFDEHFNARLQRFGGSIQAGCELQATSSQAVEHRDLELYAPATDRRITLSAADLDPETQVNFRNMSHERVIQLDATQSANTVAACAGQYLVVRLASGRPISEPTSPTQQYILGTLAGQLDNGEECARAKYLRRIEPAKLLELFDIQTDPSDLNARHMAIDLIDWVSDTAFRAKVRKHEFELSNIDAARITVSLLTKESTL